MYEHLSGLELADSGDATAILEIDLLIGSDHYWKLVTSRVVKGTGGPTAIEARLGRVLSGPAEGLQEDTVINLVSTHSSYAMRVESITEPEFGCQVDEVWKLESWDTQGGAFSSQAVNTADIVQTEMIQSTLAMEGCTSSFAQQLCFVS